MGREPEQKIQLRNNLNSPGRLQPKRELDGQATTEFLRRRGVAGDFRSDAGFGEEAEVAERIDVADLPFSEARRALLACP